MSSSLTRAQLDAFGGTHRQERSITYWESWRTCRYVLALPTPSTYALNMNDFAKTKRAHNSKESLAHTMTVTSASAG